MAENKKWIMRYPGNYKEYLELVKACLTKGFTRVDESASESNISLLEKLADRGYEAVGISHFDEKGDKIEGVMEVYVRAKE